MTDPKLASTGIKGLDLILQNLRLGDNVVWQVESIEEYKHFVMPFVAQAKKDGKNLIYIRFARHEPLFNAGDNIKTYQVNPEVGFESFAKEIHEIVTREGWGAFYVFDCLSDLLSFWATDLMLGNFFLVTCPYLFKLDTIAYFALLRNNHSFKTVARIRETTQLLLDIFDFENNYYVHPLKVWNRYSPTMFLPHVEENGNYLPVISSVDATRLFSYMSSGIKEKAERNLDYWDRLFLRAKELLEENASALEKTAMLDQLCKIMIGREPKMLSLVKEYVTLEDLLAIKERMIGTGYVGGKSVGMLLARKILSVTKPEWENILEPHDSFFIGSDVFYSFIVENGWWELWLEHKTESGYFSKAELLKEKMRLGTFPEEIREQFHRIIEYFGQSPIIIRSSSLLEDSFGNAFAGKYESIFDVNQGNPDDRYRKFEETIKEVFSSTMSEDALSYRVQRGLSMQDEQMALLLQRVSGTQYKHYFLPFLAGVGFSRNTFVWHEDMDPRSGMLRLVFGLGTRAVNRVEGDYPAIVALDAPQLKPYAGAKDQKRFSQHEVDVLNIDENELQSIGLDNLMSKEKAIEAGLVVTHDREAEAKLKELKMAAESYIIDFNQLFAKTNFITLMREMLKTMEEAYQYPVDMEFTVNMRQGQLNVNILQCRPLQARGLTGKVVIPDFSLEKIVFHSSGNFMGGNANFPIKTVIQIDPNAYGKLLFNKKSEVARLIGKLNKKFQGQDGVMLIGPGRWGTRDASLGVPVNFAEINNFSVLVEVADPASGFMPELSFGSHFFLDLVETNIFYVALFTQEEKVVFQQDWLKNSTDELLKILPEAEPYKEVIKVVDFSSRPLNLLSDVASQKVICIRS